ncbi:ABC transporter ATP-binding protein [Piscinibacter sp.]|uniref:ABC transporter ATP-binding protein n=1 Tax=Piscinibacter sp. TaxID=1903157 RepID=UPI002C643660|nr:ABC transporter ATP-binding protein [Albitalea sp.]HUG21761.1 ABC transporter ATP-binding protein [Albitalea sp.]
MSHYLWALKPYYRQVAGQLLLGSLAGIAMNTAVVLPAVFLGRAIDAATLFARGELTRAALVQTILLFIAATLATELPRVGKRWWLMTANARIRANLRADALRGVMAWPMSTLAAASAGDIMARVVGDIEVLGVGVREVIIETWDTLLFLLSFFVAMLVLDVPLTLWALLPVPLAMALAWASGRWVRQRTTAARQANSALTAGLYESLSAMRVVRLLGARQTVASRIAGLADAQALSTLAAARPRAALPAVYTTLMTAGVLLVLWQGGEKVVAGVWTIGAFVTYLDLFLRFTGRGFRVPQLVNSVQAGESAYARIKPLLAPPMGTGQARLASFRAAQLAAAEPDPAVSEPVLRADGGMTVCLRDVSFAHGQLGANTALALDRVSLDIPAGAFVAVTGPVGSGKSALAKALLGLYPLAGGSVMLDGDTADRCRDQIGYLPQEPFLFSGTVRDNIAMGGPTTPGAAARAIDIAALAQDVSGFARGLDTEIGERGIRVSGGQRQRVALARAAATMPRLLLLDDPFSAVDVQTETQIIAGLRQAFGAGAPAAQQATIVLCSHRLAAFPLADLVVVLDQGRIVEQGTHAALLRAGGVYARIHAAQATMAAGERS